MIKKNVDEVDKYWNELLFTITGGIASEIAELKKYNIYDLFDYIENKTKKDG